MIIIKNGEYSTYYYKYLEEKYMIKTFMNMLL